MQKLRIAFLSAGRFTHIGPYIDFFKSRGHTVFLIKYDYSNKNYGVAAYDISFGARGDKEGSKWKYLLSGVSIRRLLRRLHPDILHGHYITSAGVISRMSGFRPYVLTAHGSDVIAAQQTMLWRFVLKNVLAKATLVNTVSDELSERLSGLGVPQSKLFTSTLGVDTGYFFFEERKPDVKKWRLICTRTIAEVYDPLTILEACALLKSKGVSFEMTFAAGGPMLDILKQVTKQRNLLQEVKFLCGYDNTILPDILHSNDIFLSASLWDGTSISLLEAMAAGIFPVVSRVAANTSWLEDGTTAIMFDCGDANGLAAAICRAIDETVLRRSAVCANRRLVLEKANRVKNLLALEQKYFEILGITNRSN